MDPEIVGALVASLLGLLLGLERERKRGPRGHLFAGIRTFPLFSLAGFLGALLSRAGTPLALPAVVSSLEGLAVARAADASGKDPDNYSPTLRKYHKLLWSKPLPNGHSFHMDDTVPGAYLHHRSELGEFFLSSDSVIPTFTRWRSLRHITQLFSEEENEAFRAIGYTIGGMMVFPGNRIGGKHTINVERGFNGKIADRFDLTLECVRQHYLGRSSPLRETLTRYREFFVLFGDFRGYVDFHAARPGR